MKYTRKDIEDLRIEVEFLIEKSDYEKELDNKLKEQRKTAQFKGFRKGKVPTSLIKKMYGNNILVDVLNDILGKEMDKFFEKENIKYIGEPMLADGHAPLDVDINNPAEYTFTFDLGLRPEIDIQGISEEDVYEKMAIEVDEDTLQSELDLVRRRTGKQEDVEEDIKEGDLLTIEAVEMENGDVKDKGWETSFTIMVDTLAEEDLKKDVLTKKRGDSLEFDIYKLEKDRDEAFVKKYFLNLGEEEEKEIGNDFRGVLKEVKRLMPAEMTPEFFASNFGEGIEDEAAAKNFIQEQLVGFYGNESMQLVYRNMMEKMLDSTKFDMPISFLEKWLKSQDQNKDKSDEVFGNDFTKFQKEMRWSLIKSKLLDTHGIEVKEEEIQQRLYGKAQQYMNSQMQGFADPNMMNQIFEYLAKDKNQVNQAADEVATDKVFSKLGEIVKLEEKKTSLDEFKEIVTALNAAAEVEKNA